MLRSYLKKTLAVVLCFSMVAALSGCGDVEDLINNVTGSNSTSTSVEEPEEVEPPFDNLAEVSVYKAGADSLLFMVKGEQCDGLRRLDVHTASDNQFFLLIGDTVVEKIMPEDFHLYPELDIEEGEELEYYELTSFIPRIQVFMYSLDSSVLISNGDDWDNFKSDKSGGGTYASPNGYFSVVESQGICDKFTDSGTYELHYCGKDDDFTYENMIAKGNTKDIIKGTTPEEIETLESAVYLEGISTKPELEAKWVGKWHTDPTSDIDADLTVEVSPGGLLIFKIEYDGITKYWFADEVNYFGGEEDSKDSINIYNVSVYNFAVSMGSLIIRYYTYKDGSEHISYTRDDIPNDVSIRADFLRVE